jgi:hypothetical protein
MTVLQLPPIWKLLAKYGVFLSVGVPIGRLVPPQLNHSLTDTIASVLGSLLVAWVIIVLVYLPWGEGKLTAQVVGRIAIFWALLLTAVPTGVLIGWLI